MKTQTQTVQYEAQPKVALSEFVAELAFEFPEVPEEIFANYLLRTIDEFARLTNALRRKATIAVQECVETYLLEPEDCMDLLAVMRICQCRSNGCRGPVIRLSSEPCCICNGLYSWLEEPNILHISPARYRDVFEVEFSVVPTYDACEVDRILLTKYVDTILHGVRWRLFSMPDKPWTSKFWNGTRFVDNTNAVAKRISDARALFLAGCQAASVETLINGQRGAIRAKRPRVLY